MHLYYYHYICTAQLPAAHHHHRPVVPPCAAPPFTALPITASSATRLRPARSVHLLQPTATAPPTRPWGRISSRRPAIQRPWVATVAVSCSPPPPPLNSVLGREKPWAKSYGLALDKNFCSVPAPPIPIPPSDRLGRLPLPWGDQSQRVFSSVLGHTGHVSH